MVLTINSGLELLSAGTHLQIKIMTKLGTKLREKITFKIIGIKIIKFNITIINIELSTKNKIYKQNDHYYTAGIKAQINLAVFNQTCRRTLFNEHQISRLRDV